MDNKSELIARAKAHCFFTGLNDSGAELCKANSPYGLAAIHYIQEIYGKKPDAVFISSPDMTISRNAARWKSGFGYGGKLIWGDGGDELVILDAKANACGMLVGALEKMPEAEKLIEKFHRMEIEEQRIDGVKVEWDFYKSNHFVDIFEARKVSDDGREVPKNVFILHGSAAEFRDDSNSEFGLYYDKSKNLKAMAEIVKTPFGSFHILTGKKAQKYLEHYRYVDEFAHRKRRLAAKLLFGEYEEICSRTHQGLLNMNQMVLGCHYVDDENGLYPLTLRADLPAYLVKGIKNYSPQTIEMLGFERRAGELGVYDRLENANVLPHGGGYTLPDILGVRKVIEFNGSRYFEVDMMNDRGKQIISEVKDLPYEYRGRNVVLRSIEANLIEIAYKLIPRFVLKI